MKDNKRQAMLTGQKIQESSRKDRSFPIVAIGGSAGAFPSYEKFFTHMPIDSGMAFIIVTHLDPNHQGNISQLIGSYTQMPVFEAEDGMEINPNNVYTIPPNRDMGVHNRKLLLLKISKPRGYHQPIDYFLQSLADDQWNKAVAIIMSGMGSDGETGVRMLKEKLGMVMVQDPQTASYSSMPLAAIGTNLADYVLSPEEMPMKLIQYLNHPVLLEEPSDQAISEIRNENSIHKILMLLRSHTGHDFSQYKKSTIIRRIDRRIAYHQQPDYTHYVNFLRENPQEIDILFNEMLIGVTKFFRDSFAFDSLQNKLMKLISEKKIDNEPARVWIAGCSTGEEAYSVAMILIECLEQHMEKMPKVQIFATDLDAEAIKHARSGFYRSNIVADVSEERIKRFFVKTEAGYTIKKELREMIVFAQHNLIKDAPFTRLDLVCCRNVMIYLTAELQKKIIPIFHYALKVNGLMLLGPAETVGGFSDLFTPIDPKWKIFERKSGDASLNKMIDFPFHVSKPALSMVRMEDTKKKMPRNFLADTFNKLLMEHFTPTCVLINEQGEIQYTKGKTGRFFELPSGEVVMNVLKMAREEIRYVLSNIIHKARSEKGMVAVNDIRLDDEGQVRLFNIQAMLLEENHLNGYILIVFEDKGMLKNENARDAGYQHSSATEDLEKELVYTKQQLSSTIEQMETSLEELKSTNEELQSTNEELQSTNEESLTTKEEMQSLNEELMTINAQYESKAEELSRLNNDMKNLLDATEIGTVFLNNELEILRYTPQVCKLFNVIPTDIGRPLAHVVPKFDFALEEKIKEVIDSLQTQELELRTKTNEWYRVRVMPYRTLDNFISGAVLTFSVITEYKKMEFRLQNMHNYANEIIQFVPQPMVKLNADLTVQAVNRQLVQAFGLEGKETKGLSFEKLMQDHLGKGLSTFSDHIRTSKVAIGAKIPGVGTIEGDFDLTSMPVVGQEMNEIETIFVLIKKQ